MSFTPNQLLLRWSIGEGLDWRGM